MIDSHIKLINQSVRLIDWYFACLFVRKHLLLLLLFTSDENNQLIIIKRECEKNFLIKLKLVGTKKTIIIIIIIVKIRWSDKDNNQHYGAFHFKQNKLQIKQIDFKHTIVSYLVIIIKRRRRKRRKILIHTMITYIW